MNPSSEPPRSWEDMEAAGMLAGFWWLYVAAEDACPVGRALDGRRFATLADLREVLPELGQPNPACPRPGSCACTALPAR